MADVWPEVLTEARSKDESQREQELQMPPADASLSSPAAVSHFDELENVLGAFDLPLLQPNHLHLLLAVLQDSELSFAVQQVKHLQVQMQSSLTELLP